jgi:hypothetical protein
MIQEGGFVSILMAHLFLFFFFFSVGVGENLQPI